MGQRVKSLRNKQSKKNNIERPVKYRNYKQFFLIVTEDGKTTMKYFEYFKNLFPIETLYLESIGAGADALGTVERAILEREKFKEDKNKTFDFIWVVFDKDDMDTNQTLISRFNQAFESANKHKIKIAYSNECFELWLLLHFTEVPPNIPVPRRQKVPEGNSLYGLLRTAIRNIEGYHNYEYNHDNYSLEVLEIVRNYGNEDLAIERAKVLVQFHAENPPLNANPSTTVHELVKTLRDWINFYAYNPKAN